MSVRMLALFTHRQDPPTMIVERHKTALEMLQVTSHRSDVEITVLRVA
jgi:hypothetical protein